MADEPFAVIDEQSQVELGPLQLRRREAVEALAQCGPSDCHRVDAVGLAPGSRAAAAVGHQSAGNPQDALAARDQEPLE